MKVIVVEPNMRPYTKDIGSDLKSLQHEVGGYIEAIFRIDGPAVILCDEEGKLNGKEPCRLLCRKDGTVLDWIAGTFIIVGERGADFCSVNPQFVNEYITKFAAPIIYF